MTNPETRAVALRYAPVFAQKIMSEWRLADQIAPLDLAAPGDLQCVSQNPDALYGLAEHFQLPAKIYYSVTETTTHRFILYAVYHVLDWWKRYAPGNLYDVVRDRLDEHVHDLEGVLLVVTKEPRDRVDALVTVAHNNFYLYTHPMRPSDVGEARSAYRDPLEVVKFNETVDGHIWLDRATDRVKVFIEARGHGIRGDHSHWGGGDEIWYYSPIAEGNEPGTLDPAEAGNTRPLDYELVDIFEPKGFWASRFDQRVFRQRCDGRWSLVFADKNGRLSGGSANPPWSWNDHNDRSPMGEIATDPATFICRYAQGWGPVSTRYLVNPYHGIRADQP